VQSLSASISVNIWTSDTQQLSFTKQHEKFDPLALSCLDSSLPIDQRALETRAFLELLIKKVLGRDQAHSFVRQIWEIEFSKIARRYQRRTIESFCFPTGKIRQEIIQSIKKKCKSCVQQLSGLYEPLSKIKREMWLANYVEFVCHWAVGSDLIFQFLRDFILC